MRSAPPPEYRRFGAYASSSRTCSRRRASLTSRRMMSRSTPMRRTDLREYRSSSERSRIWAINGATALTAPICPVAYVVSKRLIAVSITKSYSGLAWAINARTASLPRLMRRSHGSRLSSATATNACVENAASSPNAWIAAFWPAASPSKVNTTRELNDWPSTFNGPTSCTPPRESSAIRRRTILACSAPNAVPHVAIAVSMPARCIAITSVYPSTMTAWRFFTIADLARSMP